MSKQQNILSHRSTQSKRTVHRRRGGMRSSLKRNRSTKSVQFDPNSNTVEEYHLKSDEIQYKRQKDPKIQKYPKCVMPMNLGSFPCRMGNTVFENPKEYIEFANADRIRRSSKTPSQHYEDISKMLKKEMAEKGIIGVSPLNRRIRR